GSSVNVRSGPSTSASVVGSLKKGNAVEILAQSGDFYKINYGTGTAYISSSYVRVTGTVSTATPTPTPTPRPDSGSSGGNLQEGEALVISSGTALMGDPSGSVIYAYLSKNDVVTILDTEGSYCLVRTKDGDMGYVAKSALQSAATATPTPTPTPGNTGSTTRQGTIKLSSSSSNLNLRQGPSTSTSVLATLRHGQSVTVTGESGDWYAIEVNGYSGYVMKTYVTFSESEDTSSGTELFPAVIQLSSSSSTVNVRSGAGTNYSKIGSLTNGASVNVVASNGDWYRIEYGNGYGYVMKTYVKLVSSGSGSSSSGDANQTTAVTTTAVNLRKEGTTSSDKLGTFPKGTRVVVLEKGSSWSRVDISGNQGYMKNTYLDFDE
ncbi:MAG: SH3 domain-containing protein, partial [Candidatus Spyradocola sp.]